MPAWSAVPGGLRLHLRVTPNAGLSSIEGVEARDDSTLVLRLRIAAAPDKGKANAAVVALLSNALGTPKSAIAIVAGRASRLKTVDISGDADGLIAALVALTALKP